MNGRTRNRALAAGIAGIATLGITLTVANGAAPGTLLPVEEQASASLSNANGVAVAPNGRQVYGVGFASDEIGTFDRNASTGAITFADSTEGDGLNGPNSVAVAPDGDHAYVAGNISDSVHAYEINASGILNNIDQETDGNGGFTALDGAYDVVVAPGGNHVYATGSADDAVVLLTRDNDGELGLGDEFIDGLGDIPANTMRQPRGIAVSPDGRNVYVASATDGAIATFRRFTDTGQLDFVEDDSFGFAAQDVAVSPDGTRVYAGYDDGVRTFRRNASTGALTDLGVTAGPPNDVLGVAASPDGGNVYTSFGIFLSEGVATLATTPNAKLRFVETDEVSFDDATAVAVSGDGRHVYLAGGGVGDGHIAVFSRQPKLELKGKKQQDGDPLKVKAECSADCTAKLKAKGYKPSKKKLRAGKPRTMKLKPKGAVPSVEKVKVKGKAVAGNRTDKDGLKIKLT
jgi:DNA-binding beta-propeller fold protein YncE